ncbi:hypothetical protein MRX96_058168 [Rhipicephalus microplus]
MWNGHAGNRDRPSAQRSSLPYGEPSLVRPGGSGQLRGQPAQRHRGPYLTVEVCRGQCPPAPLGRQSLKNPRPRRGSPKSCQASQAQESGSQSISSALTRARHGWPYPGSMASCEVRQ